MTHWPKFQEGERLWAFEDGRAFECIVLADHYDAGDSPDNPSTLVLRRKGTLQRITRYKDQVSRDGVNAVRPDEEPTT
jgi:hypothetical protein